MKKYFLLVVAIFNFGISEAQYTKLLDFGSINGQPFGGINATPGDSVLYGITNCVFSIKPDGSGYRSLHNFSPNGSHGSLVRLGDTLYGMTMSGGTYGAGFIFSYKINSGVYTTIYEFGHDSADGAGPEGSLIVYGNMLYGMTYSGGKHSGSGTIFSLNINGTGYSKIHDFADSTIVSDGQHPLKDLVISGNTLYGMTLYGGANGTGIIFSIQTNGTAYTRLLDFNNANGNMPMSSLVIAGNVLFGGANGGPNSNGLIFSIRTNGTGYKDLYDFNGTDGINPNGLTLFGSTIYGTTLGGGTNNHGTIYSIDTSGAGFQNLYNFNSVDGNQPRAALALSGNMLYGTTVMGGIYDDGTIFSLQTHPPAIPICMVTVDDASQHNTIVWEKPASTNIDSFIVYREITTNSYMPIGAVPYAALSQFVDTVATKYFPFTGNPNSGTYRYKLQVKNLLGNKSNLSPYHNTIFVTQSGGTFSWNQYEIEGNPIPLPSISAYVLYRDDNSTGSWHQVIGVAGTQTTATDPNYSSYPNGSWRVETMWGITCTPTVKTTSSYSTSKSNVKSSAVGVNSFSYSQKIDVYPSPTSQNISISSSNELGTISIYNNLGGIVLHTTSKNKTEQIDISNLQSGIYFIQAHADSNIYTSKFVKE
jgi:uncharacterized repeat protein (TIGR03803 family)